MMKAVRQDEKGAVTVQELDERLAAVAAFVPLGARFADIGADHAKLPLALVAMERIAHAVAVEVHEGPFAAAERAVRLAGCTAAVEVRLGDGLSAIRPGEVDAVAVAGMGGSLISRILTDGAAVLQEVKTLILQPQSDAAELRAWLYAHDWHIADESLALAGGRIYEVLLAKPGREDFPAPILLEIGPLLWQKKPPLLRAHIEHLILRARRAAFGMEKSARAKESAAYRALKEKIASLKERLIW